MSARRERQRARKAAGPAKATRMPRVIPPTELRRYVDGRSHMPPASMADDTGGMWRGASRVLDRAARRRSERRSWRELQAQGRRDFLGHGSE